MVIKKYKIFPIIFLLFFLLLLPTASLGAPNCYPCPCSIWSSSDTPAIPAQDDALPIELGVQFRSDDVGYITGVRFYKGPGNTGPHYGHLWTTSGTLLGTATFTNETDSGWQEATFPTPIAITANTTYIASYHAPSGHWSLTTGGLSSEVYNQPLRALANGDVSPGNGIFTYGPTGSFPNYTDGSSNYWVDVVFSSDITPPTVNAVTPANNAIDVNVHTNLTAVFSEELLSSTVSPDTFELRDPDQNLIPASVTYANGLLTAILDPTSWLAASTTYTVRIKGGRSIRL